MRASTCVASFLPCRVAQLNTSLGAVHHSGGSPESDIQHLGGGADLRNGAEDTDATQCSYSRPGCRVIWSTYVAHSHLYSRE